MKNKIYINAWGGLGDVVLATPLFKQLKANNPGLKIVVVSPTNTRLKILENNPYIDKLKVLNPYLYILSYLRLIEIKNISYGRYHPSYTFRKKTPEIIAEIFGVTLIDKRIQLFVTNKEDKAAKDFLSKYTNPVLVQITSRTTKNQMWPAENWNALVLSMPEFTFIQLGAADEYKIEGAIDMRGKTSIREAIALMKNAASFVGVVSFLSHVTNAFNTPGVILFGGVSAVPVWGHDNNINISKVLPCSPCVDFIYGQDCPYDKPCMRMITVDEVRSAIIKQVPVAGKKVQNLSALK
jgi:ADP-heptose:LPS heptosyltransferase